MKQVMPWLFAISLVVFIIDWSVVGLKILNGDYEVVKIKGMYFDFLLLNDRFLGRAAINGLEYEPFDDHSSYKFMDSEGLHYFIRIQRYDTGIQRCQFYVSVDSFEKLAAVVEKYGVRLEN